MLTLLRAPVKIRFGIRCCWLAVAVLSIVETSSDCAIAQESGNSQSVSETSQDVPDVDPEAAAEREKAEQKAQQEAAQKQAMAIEECQRLVAVGIGRITAPEIFPDVLAKSTPENTMLLVSLSQRTLTVNVAGEKALLCAIACGRVGMETETGDFVVVSKSDRAPVDCHYGSLVDERGSLFLKGIYSGLDPVPVGTTFVASPPNAYIVLSEDVVIHSGDANGTASTDGAVVIPTTAARTLLKILGSGVKVTIE